MEILRTALSSHAILSAAAVTSLFALAGYRMRGVSRSGALAGFVVAFLLYTCAGSGAFGTLVALFALTWSATRLGRPQKLRLGTAEPAEERNAAQVLANVGVASLFAIAYKTFGNPACLAACAAALAEAASDTVSSECGQAVRGPTRLVTTGAVVPAGANGGISLAGTACGALAAIGMSWVAVWTGLVGRPFAWAVAAAALLGTLFDSLLGATLERPGWLDNNAVNLAGTLSAALLASWWVG